VADYLIRRRDRIGETYFSQVLPLDRFGVGDGRLLFDDLAQESGIRGPRDYRVAWTAVDNLTAEESPIPDAAGFELPPAVGGARAGEYFAATITDSSSPGLSVRVHIGVGEGGPRVVGVRRDW
jgi:hypothetical protein